MVYSLQGLIKKCGMTFFSDYKAGQELIKNRQFKDNAEFFQEMFEIARRYKIMNPGFDC